jgi:hypothetical protein
MLNAPPTSPRPRYLAYLLGAAVVVALVIVGVRFSLPQSAAVVALVVACCTIMMLMMMRAMPGPPRD